MSNERFTVGDGFRIGVGLVFAQIFLALVVFVLMVFFGLAGGIIQAAQQGNFGG